MSSPGGDEFAEVSLIAPVTWCVCAHPTVFQLGSEMEPNGMWHVQLQPLPAPSSPLTPLHPLLLLLLPPPLAVSPGRLPLHPHHGPGGQGRGIHRRAWAPAGAGRGTPAHLTKPAAAGRCWGRLGCCGLCGRRGCERTAIVFRSGGHSCGCSEQDAGGHAGAWPGLCGGHAEVGREQAAAHPIVNTIVRPFQVWGAGRTVGRLGRWTQTSMSLLHQQSCNTVQPIFAAPLYCNYLQFWRVEPLYHNAARVGAGRLWSPWSARLCTSKQRCKMRVGALLPQSVLSGAIGGIESGFLWC